ncbi:MAG: galactokinase [Promethearchaeota archaeon]
MEKRREALFKKLNEIYMITEDKIKIAIAPGRVNLIGGHTDYNMGFVLPCAVNKDIMIAAAPNQTDTVNLYSLNLNKSFNFSLKDLQYKAEDGWGNYAKGICYHLLENGYKIRGIDGILHGTVPIGSGMSSSAALEVSIGYIFQLLFNLNISPLDLIKIAYRAEREFIGVMCGFMDQYVSVSGVANSVIFIDCRSLDYEVIRIPHKDIKVVVLHTNIKRAAGSALNQRKNECFEAVQLFQKEDSSIEALRDVSIELFENKKDLLPLTLQKRAQHVIYENQRVLDAKNALKSGDLETVGKLMYESHKSLAELYEVSIKELDYMIKIAKDSPGVIGSRMTGAGLGGAVACLVEEKNVEKLISNVIFQYPKLTNKKPITYVCNISDGVREA